MELLTRNNFEGWMQKLMERLDRHDELLLAMKDVISCDKSRGGANNL